ncbi:hypothetical protein C8R43DRAFT_48125 [Mycena crocata]|nr:hypothetical protein C8R43DRAFT_48125 [Mycena crocata]
MYLPLRSTRTTICHTPSRLIHHCDAGAPENTEICAPSTYRRGESQGPGRKQKRGRAVYAATTHPPFIPTPHQRDRAALTTSHPRPSSTTLPRFLRIPRRAVILLRYDTPGSLRDSSKNTEGGLRNEGLETLATHSVQPIISVSSLPLPIPPSLPATSDHSYGSTRPQDTSDPGWRSLRSWPISARPRRPCDPLQPQIGDSLGLRTPGPPPPRPLPSLHSHRIHLGLSAFRKCILRIIAPFFSGVDETTVDKRSPCTMREEYGIRDIREGHRRPMVTMIELRRPPARPSAAPAP